MNLTENLSPLGVAAVAYAECGWLVFPASPTTKAPLTPHGNKDGSADPTVVARWWQMHPNALVACRIPADQIVLDIDPRYGGDATWDALEGLHGSISTRVHWSGRGDGGRHVWLTRPEAERLNVKRLNRWAEQHGTGMTVNHRHTAGIDLLHHNHRYTLLPPSPHPSTGHPYRWAGNAPGPVAPCPEWLAELLTETAEIVTLHPRDWESTGDTVFEWFNRTTTWADILTGWTLIRGSGDDDGSLWRHPSAQAAWSASIKHGCLFVYSPNTPFEPTAPNDTHGYTKFRAWATLAFDGDMTAATRTAYQRRDGDPGALFEQHRQAAPTIDHHLNEDDEPPIAIVRWPELWAIEPVEREWLVEPLVPIGRQVALFAQAKIGKSLLALEVAAALATGRPILGRQDVDVNKVDVLYIDFEMTAGDLRERLESMGYGPDDDLTRLHYALLPTIPGLDTPQGAALVVAMARRFDVGLVVIDTMARAVEGEENSADTYRQFARHLGLALKAEGRALLRIDHSGKDVERGMRGSSEKAGDVDLVWRLSPAADGTFTVRATHRRISWVPDQFSIIRHTDPLRHELVTDISWPAGTAEAAALLDQLGIPAKWGRERTRRALQHDGHKLRNDILAAAIRFRQSPMRRTRTDGGDKESWTGSGTGSGTARTGPVDDNDSTIV